MPTPQNIQGQGKGNTAPLSQRRDRSGLSPDSLFTGSGSAKLLIRHLSCSYSPETTLAQFIYKCNLSFLLVILRLRIPELAIVAVLPHQRLMAARLYNPSSVKDKDIVTESAAGHPMGDIERSLFPHQLIKPPVYVIF